ncbi:MAG: hypothetical protein IJ137_10700 [Eubacterium sp.]|nr:hypothetical protein [Eubacterium sp.]
MNQIPIKLGPLTLLLTIISICLTTLSILTFTTARADMHLAEKYADTVKTRYALEREGQAFLAEAEDALVNNQTRDLLGTSKDENGVIWKTFEQDGSKLLVGIAIENNHCRIVSWKQEKEWSQDMDIGNLWQ